MHKYICIQEQDPVAMGNLVVQSSKNSLKIRYRFLPYLYTLFFKAHKFGETVARPLFFEYVYLMSLYIALRITCILMLLMLYRFTDDQQTYDIDTQFLWGSAFMINPVLEEVRINSFY